MKHMPFVWLMPLNTVSRHTFTQKITTVHCVLQTRLNSASSDSSPVLSPTLSHHLAAIINTVWAAKVALKVLRNISQSSTSVCQTRTTLNKFIKYYCPVKTLNSAGQSRLSWIHVHHRTTTASNTRTVPAKR